MFPIFPDFVIPGKNLCHIFQTLRNWTYYYSKLITFTTILLSFTITYDDYVSVVLASIGTSSLILMPNNLLHIIHARLPVRNTR